MSTQQEETIANQPLHEFAAMMWSNFDKITIVRDDAANGRCSPFSGGWCQHTYDDSRMQVHQKSKEVVAQEKIRWSRERWHSSIKDRATSALPTQSALPVMPVVYVNSQIEAKRSAPRLPQRQSSFTGIGDDGTEGGVYNTEKQANQNCLQDASLPSILSATMA